MKSNHAPTEIRAYTTPDPDALVFLARHPAQIERPARAGSVYISREALEDHGDRAAVEGLAYLLARVEDDTLPTCPVMRKAPVLAVRDSEGLRVMREGDSLPF
ncbi:hypothetical protein [Deinococcus sp. QL22]|uniref:hypothetical protein n=1 Tax=Deinococcus sp. QL22 TaxID=2939437 RepID=UPI0020172F2D|nr:hypothetical protein [Deinococcus sp. QL22]UQN09068.1 hypothetical protein M1R55_23750 [Deinococcus sp. QL22]